MRNTEEAEGCGKTQTHQLNVIQVIFLRTIYYQEFHQTTGSIPAFKKCARHLLKVYELRTCFDLNLQVLNGTVWEVLRVHLGEVAGR